MKITDKEIVAAGELTYHTDMFSEYNGHDNVYAFGVRLLLDDEQRKRLAELAADKKPWQIILKKVE